MGTIRVAGLGPGDVDLLTSGTVQLIAASTSANAFLRTRVHPAASICAHITSFDDLYESCATFDDVYRTIVERLVSASQHVGEVLYLVPGSPMVAEHTVDLLLRDPRVDVRIEPALSFVDLSWTRLGVDPVRLGVRIVDGHRFEEDVDSFEHPLLIGQCHCASVLSDIKLGIDTDALTEIPIATVLHHLGLPDERVVTVAWPELDRIASTHGIEPDHLTSLYVPKLVSGAASAMRRLQIQMRVLRDGCPWDREQTHESLARYAVEEAYELVDAISHLDADADPTGHDPVEALEGELGDLLFQVIFHCCLATEAGWFDLTDVANTLHDKLERRHPHVFGSVDVEGVADVVTNWEAIKAGERGHLSDPFAAIAEALPALLWASKVLKTSKVDLAGSFAAIDVLRAHIDESRIDESRSDGAHGDPPDASLADQIERADRADRAVGESLLEIVAASRRLGVDPEVALRRAAARVRDGRS